MARRLMIAGLMVAGAALAGCATTSTGAHVEQDQLRAQVNTLQSQVAALSSQVEELRGRQRSVEDHTWEAGGRVAVADAHAAKHSRVVLTAKELQLALQRAGYYQGPIDGRIGTKTRNAIKTFQTANNLVADGVAGTKTMIALQAYLTSPENTQ